jgi:hypothetical protein
MIFLLKGKARLCGVIRKRGVLQKGYECQEERREGAVKLVLHYLFCTIRRRPDESGLQQRSFLMWETALKFAVTSARGFRVYTKKNTFARGDET